MATRKGTAEPWTKKVGFLFRIANALANVGAVTKKKLAIDELARIEKKFKLFREK